MHFLITGAWNNAKEHIPEIEAMGHDIVFMQHENEDIPCNPSWVEGVICNGLFLHHPIEEFINLKYIQLTSAGYDRVPMDYIKAHGIEIYNAKGVYSIPMAEFAIAGVLQLYKQSRFFYKNQIEHKWKKHRELLELYGKTIVILGCGDVGTECAKHFKAFGCKIIGLNITTYENPSFDEMKSFDNLNSVLPKADVLILAVSLTVETQHLINSERLSMLKPGMILVNIARGALIDTKALLDSLPKLNGVVLDVFEDEPLEDNSPFWDMKNVILTPHNSFVGDGNEDRLCSLILKNLCFERN